MPIRAFRALKTFKYAMYFDGIDDYVVIPLIVYGWQEITIQEWIDLSGNNNHGKIYGATLTQLVKPAVRILPKARILNVLR